MCRREGSGRGAVGGAWHDAEKDMDLRGVPLDCDEYDYSGQAYFNYRIGGLWNTTLTLLRKWFPDLCFGPERLL